MHIAVSSYSFTKLMNCGKMTQIDCIRKAREMGFDAVELVDVIPHDGSSKEAYAHRLASELKETGMELSNFTFSADFLHGCEADTQKEIDRVKSMVDLAHVLGARSIRHDATVSAGKYRTFELALPVLADACRQVTTYAQQLGIRTMVENHGTFCQDSDRVEALVSAVNHPNFGLLVDMGNFLCVDESPEKAVSRVAPLAFYVHAKDFFFTPAEGANPGEGAFLTRGGNYLRGTIIGHGCVPVRQCLKILKLAGYTGAVAIEFEGMEEPIEAIRIGLANLRRYIKEIEQ